MLLNIPASARQINGSIEQLKRRNLLRKDQIAFVECPLGPDISAQWAGLS